MSEDRKEAGPIERRRSPLARLRARIASAFAKGGGEVEAPSTTELPLPAPLPLAPPPPAPSPSPPKVVGILTLPLHTNYGGNLQAWALSETLKDLGYHPVLINRRHRPSRQVAVAVPGVSGAMVAHYALAKREPSYTFIDRYLGPFTGHFLSTEELRGGIGAYDFHAIVVGSDQVWRPKYATTMLEDSFLGFLPDDGGPRRISYAASFGADRWEYTPEEAATARRLLPRFDAVSVREDGAVELCAEHLGVAARHVLDPTLLVAVDKYRTLFAGQPRPTQEPRLLAYVLDAREITLKVLGAVAASLGLDAYATDGRRFGADREGGDTSIEGWLAAFDAASFVVTDSFHGVAFSILFNKPFVAIGNRARGLARFTSLLRQFGLENRLVMNVRELDVAAMLRPIDWDAVNARLATLRGESLDFLRSALAADRRPALPTPVARPKPLRAEDSDNRNPLGVLCSGCGACVSESAGALRIDWNADGFLAPRATSDRAVPAEAVRVCPFNPAPDAAVADEDALASLFLADAPRSNPRAGRFENAYIGYSRTNRPTSSSGGIATYVLEQLLRRGDVDALFIVGSDGAGGYRYRLVEDPARVVELSKTRYFPVTLEELFTLIEQYRGRVAVSGVACFAKAIRLKQFYHPELRERIPFVVGIVCGGLKSRHYTDYLAGSAGISGTFSAPDYRVKTPDSTALDYSFAAMDGDGRRRSIRMRRLGDMWGTGLFKARACDFCTDVLTELADISLGDAWLPEYKADGMGNSIVVTRTPLAEAIIRDGIASGELAVEETPIARIIQSQGGGYNHKQTALAFRAWWGEQVAATPVPSLRRRLLKPVPASQALVQILRGRTRARSLIAWRETRDAGGFDRRMRPALRDLRAATEAHRATLGGGATIAPDRLGALGRWLRARLSDPVWNGAGLAKAVDRRTLSPLKGQISTSVDTPAPPG